LLTHGSLFSGIGGFDLGFQRAGIETAWQVEIDAYCRRVLARHFPEAERFSDIRECGAHNLKPVDIISGGFPCQDISNAGKRAGIDGERSGLWSEYARIIRELRPRYVVVENVAALLGRGMERVLGDLAAIGYDAEWQSIRASDVGAPHRRERIWIVAYPRCGFSDSSGDGEDVRRAGAFTASGEPHDVADATCGGLQGLARREGDCQRERSSDSAKWSGLLSGIVGSGEVFPDAGSVRSEKRLAGQNWSDQGNSRRIDHDSDEGTWANYIRTVDWWAVEPDVGRVAHGIPARVDRLRGLGNAIVPQIAEWIGRRIIAA
jgi:DNA (cytosine-5)-methyltransferase 1